MTNLDNKILDLRVSLTLFFVIELLTKTFFISVINVFLGIRKSDFIKFFCNMFAYV